MLEFRVLGPLEVLRDGRPIDIGGPRIRALLAVLVLHANQVLSRERLVDEAWGIDAPASAGDGLKVYVHRLRRALGDAQGRVLATVGNGYSLRVHPDAADVLAFERLANEGRQREALALWRGPALCNLPPGTLDVHVRALEERRLAVLLDRLDADLAGGGGPWLVAELESALAEHPYCERLYAQLMRALLLQLRQAEALEVYCRARATLREVGLEPAPELRRVQREILAQEDARTVAVSARERELRLLSQLEWFWRRDHLVEGERVLEDALAVADGVAPDVLARALETAGWIALGRGNLVRAGGYYERALALHDDLGDATGDARCRLQLATAALADAAFDAAEGLITAATERIDEVAAPKLRAWLSFTQGLLALERADLATARPRFHDALQRYAGLEFPRGIPLCLVNLAEISLASGDALEAGSFARRALAAFAADGDRGGTYAAALVLSGAADARGRHPEAAALLGAVEAFAAGAGIQPVGTQRHLVAAVVARGEDALGRVAFARARRLGRSLPLAAVQVA
jgi:DNA-binding SARP family transcriptional activator